MQAKKRVLIIANELSPYLEITDFSKILNQLAVKSFEKGYEVRVIMPRFGVINERRHKLHEVVRLSGINISVDKEDYPLLIKVASLPNARLQVYFMDNEDFFRRKMVFNDENDQFFQDNPERLLFFAKSAMEIVKKFGWPPDIIHCHGWMTSLIPAFLKTSYAKEPVFAHSKVLYTAQNNQFDGTLGKDFVDKVVNSTAIKADQLKAYNKADNGALNIGACTYSDIVIFGEDKINGEVKKNFKAGIDPKVIAYSAEWQEDIESLMGVYDTLLEEVPQ